LKKIAALEGWSVKTPAKLDRIGSCIEAGMSVRNFTELLVWQKAMGLVVDVYGLTRRYPPAERFVLAAQTNRAAASIPANIAEGFRRQRRSIEVYLNHLDIACGSEGELFTHLELARRLGYVSTKELEKPLIKLGEVGRMLNGLMASLEPSRVRSRR
jgi:four helix bundle protein